MSERICTTPGCGRKHRAKGLCSRCYNRAMYAAGYVWQRKSEPKLSPCTFPGCDKPNYSRGLCAGHRMQVRRGQELRPLGLPRRDARPPKEAKPRKRKKPATPLPKGWDKPAPAPKNGPPTGTGFHEIPVVTPTDPALIAAAIATLTRHGQLDLAEMLGLSNREAA